MKYFQYIIIAVVALALGIGFYFVGSPKTARLKRFDERRINDLQSLQYQLFYHWERKGVLPASLAELASSELGYVASTDPETKQPYEYMFLAPEQYKLCAVFALSTFGESNGSTGESYARAPYYSKDPYYVGAYSWDHEAGRYCYTRTIDKAQYQKDHPTPVR